MYAPSQNLLLTNTELMIWHLYLDVAIQLNLFLLYLFFIFPPIFFPPGNFILPSQRCMVFFFFKAVPFSYPFVSSLTPSSNLPGIQLTMLLKCILNWSSRLLCNRSLSPYLHTFLLYPYFTFLILYSRIEWSF